MFKADKWRGTFLQSLKADYKLIITKEFKSKLNLLHGFPVNSAAVVLKCSDILLDLGLACIGRNILRSSCQKPKGQQTLLSVCFQACKKKHCCVHYFDKTGLKIVRRKLWMI